MSKLYCKYGAMKSGKTTDIIKTYYNYLEKGMDLVIIKPDDDEKKVDNRIHSRSGAELNCDYVIQKNVDIYNLITNHILEHNLDCILVDEAQFLTSEQIDQLSDIVDNIDIPVLCYGLRADAFTHLFPGSKRLFEVADVIEELKAVCMCKSKATYNLRLEKTDDELVPVFSGTQVSIDGVDAEYDSVCRSCYKKIKKKTITYKEKDKK